MTRSDLVRNFWMGFASVATVGVVYWVVRPPQGPPAPVPRDLSAGTDVARLVGPRLLSIAPGSLMEKKLDIRAVRAERIAYPILTITGSVAARLPSGTASPQDRWQFASPDVLSTYADWQRSRNDGEFAEKQLEKTRELGAAQETRNQEVVDRLKKLVAAGTDAPRDLAVAQADLIEGQLTTQKAIFDAQSALALATRNRAAAERGLFQAGIDPALLLEKDGTAIIVADVPEARASAAREGTACEARFYALPGVVMPGRLARVAPTLSVDRRTLRVLFEVADPGDSLKPGMFAEVGLGTEARDALLIPSDAVLHVGRGDYVFARSTTGPWRIAEVDLGEARGERLEVRAGIVAGDEVIGSGAILLKPFLLSALENQRMVPWLLTQALRHRLLSIGFAIAIVAAGVFAYLHQQIDAYPDISAQMVQVITTFPGRAPEEVERQVTIPIELAMGNVPRVETIRSRTIFGLSLVQLEFEEGVEMYWARQRVQEKLPGLPIPSDAAPQLGAPATAYGEVYRYELRTEGTQDIMELRRLNDWVVIPRILRTPGVADVSNFGGLSRQFAITLEPAQLVRYGIALGDVIAAVQSNNATSGGSVISRGSMSFVVRGQGAITGTADIGSIFVKTVGGTPVLLRDVATVGYGAQVPSGIFSKDRLDEGVEGIVLMRRGENPSDVLQRVEDAVEEVNADVRMPDGVKVHSFYDRSTLVDSTLHTVGHSVVAGITLVLLVLLMFMGSPRMATLVALTIPFSLLFALVCMYATGIPIGLLSIGAIDFGIIVDGAVIMADNIAHRMSQSRGDGGRWSLPRTVLAAALEVERPVFFAVLMIIGAYLPLLTLTSIEGLLFRPMALTLVFALVGALLFALFIVPALAVILFPRGYEDADNPVLTWIRPRYGRAVAALLRVRIGVVVGVLAALVATVAAVVPRLGTEFMPYLDEGVIWVRANFPEGTSLEQTARFGKRIREVVLEQNDVKFVAIQSGRNDSGTDPFPPSRMEMIIGPRPREEWTQVRSKQELVERIGARLRGEFPTSKFNFTQPIIDSVTEDTNGTSANLAVEFAGSDSDVLLALGKRTVALLQDVPGAVDVGIEQEGPQPQLVVRADRALAARYKVRMDDVAQLINTALGGQPVGSVYEGEQRFDIVAKFSKEAAGSPEAIGRLPVFNADGMAVPLSQVAEITLVDGQTLIAREDGRRRITVRCDIVGRDQGGFVAEAQAKFEGAIDVPKGVRAEWLGMFENLQRARRHFAILIPITVALIYVLLVVTFASQKAALVVLLSVPFAFVGGAIALVARGMTLNVSSGVGFAALFGVSIMNGVLLVRWVTALRIEGRELETAIVQGAQNRLRPILMASIVAILGLLPASLATGLGSDVQRPLATVIVWGLLSSTVLTLFIVPVLYRIAAPALPQRTSEDDELAMAAAAPRAGAGH